MRTNPIVFSQLNVQRWALTYPDANMTGSSITPLSPLCELSA